MPGSSSLYVRRRVPAEPPVVPESTIRDQRCPRCAGHIRLLPTGRAGALRPPTRRPAVRRIRRPHGTRVFADIATVATPTAAPSPSPVGWARTTAATAARTCPTKTSRHSDQFPVLAASTGGQPHVGRDVTPAPPRRRPLRGAGAPVRTPPTMTGHQAPPEPVLAAADRVGPHPRCARSRGSIPHRSAERTGPRCTVVAPVVLAVPRTGGGGHPQGHSGRAAGDPETPGLP